MRLVRVPDLRVSQAFRKLDDKFWGGLKVRLEAPPTVVSVGTTATQLIGANPNRVQLFAQNKSANPGHVHTDRNVSTSRGQLMSQQGGFINPRYEEDGSYVQSAFFALNETGAGDYYVWALELAE